MVLCPAELRNVASIFLFSLSLLLKVTFFFKSAISDDDILPLRESTAHLSCFATEYQTDRIVD